AVNWWKKTPAHDKMHQVVEVPVGFLTNAILFGCCASFASKLATAACAEALAITRKSNPAITSAGAATSEAVATAVQRTKAEAVKLLEKLSEAEQIAQAPASVLKEEVERIRPVRKTCPTNIQEFWHATTEAIEKAIERIMPKELKNEHIFRKEHKFDDLIKLCGGTKESTVRAMLEAASGHIPADGVFQWIPIKIGNINLYICGRIMDGVPLIGTCFKRMV
ncbi:MAG TPA: hypothetical protein VGT41_04910, partial [Candidatus Babeliales bacterium]|nr:hypothetical protein [Candidatus Babeliales bacterium]